jgi:uncharacterized protein
VSAVISLAIVVDTNLFVSAIISPTGAPARLLDAWRQGIFRLLLSDAQFDEIAGVISRAWLRERYRVTPSDVAGLLVELEQRAERIRPLAIADLPLHSRDADDDVLLACALSGSADYLITGDEDLLVLDGDERLGGLRIVRVTEFLALIGH